MAAEEMEESAELPIWVTSAGLEFDLEHEVFGVRGRTLGAPAVSEQTHAVPRGQRRD